MVCLEGLCGGALVVNLKAKSITAQSIVVQTITSKIRQMLENPDSTPLFILRVLEF